MNIKNINNSIFFKKILTLIIDTLSANNFMIDAIFILVIFIVINATD